MAEASVPRPIMELDPRAITPPRGIGVRLPRGEERRRLVWRGLWIPFWLGSDVPPPEPPTRPGARPAEIGLAGEVVVKGLNQVTRRLWLRHALHVLVRAVWLGLAVGCAWLLIELRGGPDLVGEWWLGIAAGLGALGILFAVINRPSRRQTARMLDRSFGLQERLTTAVDHLGRGVPRPGERASVVYLQMADAANVIHELRRHRALGFRLPVRESVLAVFCGLLLAALYFLRGVGGDIPPLAAGAVPPFTPAVERPPAPDPAALAAQQTELVPTVEEVLQRSERSHAAQRDLQTLARALDDHAVTRTAADEIGRGDYTAAADDLRELAPHADQLSPAAREELARDLDQAATQMSPGSAGLSNAAQEAAAGLRQGEAAAQAGVHELGEAVERSGAQVASQQELAEQMRQAQEADARGRRDQAGQSGPASAGDPNQSGFAQAPLDEGALGEAGDAASGQPGQSGAPMDGAAASGLPGLDDLAGQAGMEAGQPGAGQPGDQPGAPSGVGAMDQTLGAGPDAQQGGGAGSGESQLPDGAMQAGAPGESGETGADGAPADQRVTAGSGDGAVTDDPSAVTETILLPPAPGGESIQTSNDGGSANRGSGAGVTAGSGTAVQGEVGDAGPDSNRVPPPYRTLVERYFSGPDGE